jgi:hypothetical protein
MENHVMSVELIVEAASHARAPALALTAAVKQYHADSIADIEPRTGSSAAAHDPGRRIITTRFTTWRRRVTVPPSCSTSQEGR